MAAASLDIALYGVEASAGAIGMAVAAVTAIVQAVLDAFGIDLFGGASRPTPLPMQIRFGHYPAGEFIGVLAALFPDMEDSAPQMGRYILAQYVRGPEYRVAPQPEFRKPAPPEIRNGAPRKANPGYSCNFTNLAIGAAACVGLGVPCVSGVAGEPEDAPLTPAIKGSCAIGALGCLGAAAEAMCCVHPASACNSPDRDLSNWSNW